MIARRITVFIAAGLMTILAIACFVAAAFVPADAGVTMQYESALFSQDQIIQIDILMDEDDWNDMLENAAEEEYYRCDVVVNGTTFQNVGIRPKGNTSLSAIVNDPTTDRYSFKLEFDHYVEGQTCFGLDKLVLNNNYADVTNRKEALVYDMYRFLGADASLVNYANISVNGESRGVYLALEGVEDSFLLRNYGAENAKLYKPEGVGGGDTGGADLNYTDDDTDSYTAIWDGAASEASGTDKKRVIAALKKIAAGEDLEDVMDVDNLLRYMAVHVFCVNDDSLSGNMAHNYYLCEISGQLNLIPWDYNLSFGGMGGSDASSVVNSPIDGAFTITQFFDALMENEAYRAQYHDYLRQLAEEYVGGGAFDEFCDQTSAMIDELCADDPTAFYTEEETAEAVQTLYRVVQLRAESVLGQVEGTIPSTRTEQKDSDALVDASGITLSVMETMNMGGGGGNAVPDRADFDANGGEMPQMPESGEWEDEDGAKMQTGEETERMQPPSTEDMEQMTQTPDDDGARGAPPQGGFPNADGSAPFGNETAETESSVTAKAVILYGASFAALLVAVLLVLCFCLNAAA